MKEYTPAGPGWFLDAINTPCTIKQVDVDSCPVEYIQWGENSKPVLVMVHGNGGHANWWDFIAPSLMDNFCVCAIHMSGMGNSGWRDEYTIDQFAREVIAVASDAGHPQDITIVGHSMGGIVTMRAAQDFAGKVRRVVILDSPLIFKKPGEEGNEDKPQRPTHINYTEKKYYPDFATALGRFRLVPEQPCANDFLLKHVGSHSIRKFSEGYSWKFDPGIYTRFKRTGKVIDRSAIKCQYDYIYGNQSALVPEAVIPELQDYLKELGPVHKLEGAHHHMMLDKPLELITMLENILAE